MTARLQPFYTVTCNVTIKKFNPFAPIGVYIRPRRMTIDIRRAYIYALEMRAHGYEERIYTFILYILLFLTLLEILLLIEYLTMLHKMFIF